MNNQRLFDLVRHQRNELHDAGLITDEEYEMLASATGSVERLEDYDRSLIEAQEPCGTCSQCIDGLPCSSIGS